MRFIALSLLLTGCTVSISDNRVTREEVNEALTRVEKRILADEQAIQTIATAVKELQDKKVTHDPKR